MRSFAGRILGAALLVVGGTTLSHADDLQDKVGADIKELIRAKAERSADRTSQLFLSKAAKARFDANDRVLVKIPLDGKASALSVKTAIEAAGGRVTGEAAIGTGFVNAYIPLDAAARIAATAGVRSVTLSVPHLNVGAVTSEGLAPMLVDKLFKQAYEKQGAGITVGVLSDSYARRAAQPNAAADVVSGDLPGPGGPPGNLTAPVIIIEEGPVGSTDEGRAMAQIVHDVAPKARLCFASAFNGEASFAANILALADRSGPCKADIIVDDVVYFDEPSAQDGIVGDAVETVSAMGVAYFTSAGNQNGTGYRAVYNPVDFATAAAAAPTIGFNSIPGGSRPLSFHNFATDGSTAPVQRKSLTDVLALHWDDPTLNGKVTRDFAIYVFRASDGLYLGKVDDVNATTDTPAESLGFFAEIYVAYGLRSTDADPRKSVLHTVMYSGVDRTFFQATGPELIGHECTRHVFATAAVFAGNPTVPEDYSSSGPCYISYDRNGNRIPLETRMKPDIAAPDGVSTTFFSGANGPSGFPRFFGTSAAAPHAAAVAALLQADVGRIDPSDMKKFLQATAQPHTMKAQNIALSLGDKKTRIDIAVQNVGPRHTDDFTVTLSAVKNGASIIKLELDFSTEIAIPGSIEPNVLIVDPASAVQPGSITITPDTDNDVPSASYAFPSGLLTLGKSFIFGVRYNNTAYVGPWIPAAIQGTTARVTLSDGRVFAGRFALSEVGTGWDRIFGYGLIDANKALALARKLKVSTTASVQ